VLDLEHDSKPISGRLWPPGDDPPLVFNGWIELTAAIEALRTGNHANPKPATPQRAQQGTHRPIDRRPR
jgi:hypothetical protein